jgi:hypothetical protein
MSNIALLNQDLPDFLQNAGVSELTKKLAGKSAGVKRIVPKNGIFRKVVGGEEMGKIKGTIDAIIVNASPHVGRIFYMKQWSPESEPTAPDCFSNDGQSPDSASANPQADRCDNCQQNIKGSGMGNSKACRYSRRLAMVLTEDFGTSLEGEIYQMNLASKSLFGDVNVDNAFTFENYTKYLANNGKSLDYVVTTIGFNEDNDNQSVLFTPARFINRNEHEVSSKVAAKPEVQKLVVMTPYQADTAGKALPAPTKAEPAKAEAVAEPTKRESKPKAEAPAAKKDLDAVVKAWSDEE